MSGEIRPFRSKFMFFDPPKHPPLPPPDTPPKSVLLATFKKTRNLIEIGEISFFSTFATFLSFFKIPDFPTPDPKSYAEHRPPPPLFITYVSTNHTSHRGGTPPDTPYTPPYPPYPPLPPLDPRTSPKRLVSRIWSKNGQFGGGNCWKVKTGPGPARAGGPGGVACGSMENLLDRGPKVRIECKTPQIRRNPAF